MKTLLRNLVSFSFWRGFFSRSIRAVPQFIYFLYLLVTFFILLLFFAIDRLVDLFEHIPFLGKVFTALRKGFGKTLKPLTDKLVGKIDKTGRSEVRRSYLISIAYDNLAAKKARSIITILGMSVGVGVIVLLLSLGYGVERLIISKIASLDELKIVDISASGNTALRLDKSVFDKIRHMANVESVVPLISTVGRITFGQAKTDVLVYAAPNSFLDLSKVKLIKGKPFAKNDEVFAEGDQEVAGASTKIQNGVLGGLITGDEATFNVVPQTQISVWDACSTNGQILGYTTRIEGGYSGQEYWGPTYYPFTGPGDQAFDSHNSVYLGRWMKGEMPLYSVLPDNSLQPLLGQDGRQEWVEGCITENSVQVLSSQSQAAVLGDATSSALLADSGTPSASDGASAVDQSVAADATATPAATFDSVVVGTDSAGVQLVELDASAAAGTTQKPLKFLSAPSRHAMVSTGMLSLLGVPTSKAIGMKFSVQFILSQNLIPSLADKSSTNDVIYTVTGVIDDPTQQYFYIPFADMQKLGVDNYSQLKIVLTKQEDMPGVRKQIETLGFKTTSTLDTVSQIEGIFANLRLLLGLLGLVALGVASLGMFNTLTVSLLERTREIGGMKTMGMVSDEVRDLFLAEAMIMGLSGGIGGIMLGFLVGKLLSLGVSLIAFSKGQGYLDLTYIPPFLTLFIIVSSFLVGIATGLYPAWRAKKISALNALRYE